MEVPRITSVATAPKTWWFNASEIVNLDARSCFELGRAWRTILETLLYRPVKTFLEGLGFVVKGEIGGCDLFALRGDDPPVVVIGELKLTFNLELVLQVSIAPPHATKFGSPLAFRRAAKGVKATQGFATFAEGSVSACSECSRMARLI